MMKIRLGLYWCKDGHTTKVTKMLGNNECEVTETWIAEDTGKDCKDVRTYKIAVDGNEEYIYGVEYEKYAKPGNDEYDWWARTYATGAINWEPEMETKEENKMTNPNKYTGEFTFEGRTYETNTKGNYFYVTDIEAGYCRKRIGREAYEKAWEEYLQTKEDNAQTDENIDDKHAVFSDNPITGETFFHGFQPKEEKKAEKKTKKVAKPRKSKDIAHESNGVTLTKKQVEFIKLLPKCSFWENGLDSALWCDCIADDIGWNGMSVGAMISTLREKNLVVVTPQKVNGKKCKGMEFTELGKAVAKDLGLE